MHNPSTPAWFWLNAPRGRIERHLITGAMISPNSDVAHTEPRRSGLRESRSAPSGPVDSEGGPLRAIREIVRLAATYYEVGTRERF